MSNNETRILGIVVTIAAGLMTGATAAVASPLNSLSQLPQASSWAEVVVPIQIGQCKFYGGRDCKFCRTCDGGNCSKWTCYGEDCDRCSPPMFFRKKIR